MGIEKDRVELGRLVLPVRYSLEDLKPSKKSILEEYMPQKNTK